MRPLLPRLRARLPVSSPTLPGSPRQPQPSRPVLGAVCWLGLLTFSLWLTAAAATAQMWEPIGPDLGALEVGPHALRFHPYGDDIRFFVLGRTTLWQVDQGGELWRRLDPPPHRDPLFRFPYSEALAVDPMDPGRFTWFVRGRFLTTTDDGQTWSQFHIFDKNYPIDNFFVEAQVHPLDPSRVYVVGYASEGDERYSRSYQSSDGGRTWRGWVSPSSFPNLMLRFAPHNPERLYIGGSGLYRSSDDGRSWETLLSQYEYEVIDMAFGGPNDQVLYVIANGRLQVSTDSGATFDTPAGASELSLDLVVGDPRNAQVLYVSTTDGEILRSLDGGASFAPMQTGMPTGVAVRDLQLDPRFGEHLYALTDEQLYRWRREEQESPRDCRGCLTPSFATPARPISSQASTPPTSRRAQLATASLAGTSIEASSPALNPRTGGWQALGPEGGPLSSLAVCPSDSETVYAAARHHVFVSHDSAETWKLAGVLPRGEVRELACDAANADRVYADAGNDGLWRGDNEGSAWIWLTNPLVDPPASPEVDVSTLLAYPQRMAVDPTHGNSLYLAAGSLYRSLDAGDTWEALEAADPALTDNPSSLPTSWCQVAVSQVDGALLAQPCLDDSPLTERRYGIWRSDDEGVTWQQLTSDPLGPRVFSDPVEADRAVVLGYTQPWLETFGGRRWYPRGSGLPAARLRTLAMHPQDPDQRLVATYDQLLRSEDGGVSFLPVDDPDLDGRRLQDLRIAPGPPIGGPTSLSPSTENLGPYAYLATDAGLLRTRDDGVAWTPMDSGLRAWPVARLQAHPTVDGYLLLLAEGHGWRSLDGGASWQRLGEPSAGRTLALSAAPSDAQVLYASTERGIWRSDDGGASWHERVVISGFEVRDFAIDPDDPLHVYAGGLTNYGDQFPDADLYESLDGGATWSYPPLLTVPNTSFFDLAFDPSQKDRLYAAGPGLYRREANSWHLIAGGGLGGPTVVVIAFDPTQPGVFYAATREAGVLRGQAQGTVEAPANVGLPGRPVRAITVAADGTVYAGLDEGIYSSTDGGDTWQPVSSGERDALSRNITALATGSDGSLYAGTADHGVHGLN